MTRNDVLELIYEALENLKEYTDVSYDFFDENTILFAENSQLDSLSLVSVIVDVETELMIQTNLELSLTDDRAMSHEPSPFDTVTTLLDYIILLLGEQGAISK
jgi:acyl carrier protein